jgi:lipopolysaccharide transport system ATP-binding protein
MALAIKVEHVSKAYRLGSIGTGTLSKDFERWLSRIRGKEDPFLKIGETNDRTTKGKSDVVWSLQDVNFEIEQGEAVGIIGANGAGKSTLLKILSRVTTPTTGSISGNGRIASLLEVGTGFHPELTGRENIYLNGAILGMRKKEISQKFDEMVDFAGVERYIDTPVKRYSSGMYVRLAFSVAAFLEAEILILDEVLAVGDAEFQKKCLGKIGEVSEHGGKTVLFVSHDLNAVSRLCTKGILLNRGQIGAIGKISSIVSTYLSSSKKSAIFEATEETVANAYEAYLKSIRVVNEAKQVTPNFTIHDSIYLDIEIEIIHLTYEYSLLVLVLDSMKRRVFACESPTIKEKMTLMIPSETLVRGDYSVMVLINIPGFGPLDEADDVCNFTVIDTDSFLVKHGEWDYGNVFVKHEWR